MAKDHTRYRVLFASRTWRSNSKWHT